MQSDPEIRVSSDPSNESSQLKPALALTAYPAELSFAPGTLLPLLIVPSEGNIRAALTEARTRGLRNFKKYPPEDWEEPLSAEERKQYGLDGNV